MINHIKASVRFPISGEVLNVDLSPPPGLTAIVGRNGSGKTFTGSELPRFLLFGKAALRGAADDYKTLDAAGLFTIAGEQYAIERNPRKEQIVDSNGKVLAVGAKAVTAKVEEIFGYGLEVFDICNASVQKGADAFGKMLPAARKRMIDRVCGLRSVEQTEKDTKAKATEFKTTAEALTRTLRKPEPVETPEGYKSSSEWTHSLRQMHVTRAKAFELQAQIKPVQEPEQPNCSIPKNGAIAELEAEQTKFIENEAERRRLDSITQRCILFDPNGYTAEQLDAAEARLKARLEIERRGPKPTMPLEHSESDLAQWAVVAAYEAKPNLEATCPKCDHTFETAGERPWMPKQSPAELREQQKAWQRWSEPEPEMPEGPDLDTHEISRLRQALANRQRHDEAAAALKALPKLPDFSETLTALRNDLAEWQAYEKQLARYDQQLAANKVAQDELTALGKIPDDALYQSLTDCLHNSLSYEKAKTRYDKDLADFQVLSREISHNLTMSKAFADGAKALSEARTELKSALTPLLSTVASSLIHDMTNGELKSVVVDEDMEITIDGRRIETLSGAGVTVANIALRIGLGQVLVKNTFPVFLGDEMDSDADAVRSAATVAAMRNLRGRLSQIVLITHKGVEDVDMTLDLTK